MTEPEGAQVLVTGGAGYVGAVLIPKLLKRGYRVKVLDLFIYGEQALEHVRTHPRLRMIRGDIRDQQLLRRVIPGCDAVIHLACISNDPSYELNPELGKSINFDAFGPLVCIAKLNSVKRFIYASSSSVYGVQEIPDVTESTPLEPLTDYSKYKAKCEAVLCEESSDDFCTTIIRPATVCGYSPRQRFDLTVNILTNHAVNKGQITVFGGSQMRPNIHIEDMTDLYLFLLEQPPERVANKVYNVGYQNYTVAEIAELVRANIPGEVPIITEVTDDIRSYHVNSELIKSELGFSAVHSIEEAVRDLVQAFERDLLPNPLTDDRYYNVKRMNKIALA